MNAGESYGTAPLGWDMRVLHHPQSLLVGIHESDPSRLLNHPSRTEIIVNQTIAIADASVGETPAERNLTRSLDAKTRVYKISDGHFPPLLTGLDWAYDGVFISGSQTSVYDDLDWIRDLTSWLRDLHRADVPVLGIYWGHQLLAQALGGQVVDMGEHELGYRTVHQRGDDPLFAGAPVSFTAFQTHSDQVAELPAGAVELARNDRGIQAFRVGASYGVQFHPECDRETAEWSGSSATRTSLLNGSTRCDRRSPTSRSRPPSRRHECSRTSSAWSPPTSAGPASATEAADQNSSASASATTVLNAS